MTTRVRFYMENDTTVTLEVPHSVERVLELLELDPTYMWAGKQRLARLGEQGTVGVRMDKVISFQITEIEEKA